MVHWGGFGLDVPDNLGLTSSTFLHTSAAGETPTGWQHSGAITAARGLQGEFEAMPNADAVVGTLGFG